MRFTNKANWLFPLFFLFLSGCNRDMDIKDEAAKYNVPAAKKIMWDGAVTALQRQHLDCREDCAKYKDCLVKCDRAFSSLLEREHKKLTYEAQR